MLLVWSKSKPPTQFLNGLGLYSTHPGANLLVGQPWRVRNGPRGPDLLRLKQHSLCNDVQSYGFSM